MSIPKWEDQLSRPTRVFLRATGRVAEAKKIAARLHELTDHDHKDAEPVVSGGRKGEK